MCGVVVSLCVFSFEGDGKWTTKVLVDSIYLFVSIILYIIYVITPAGLSVRTLRPDIYSMLAF